MKKILLITLLTFIYACSTKVDSNQAASSRINKSEDNSREIFKELDE